MILKTLGGLLEKRMQLLPDESVKCSNLEELKIIEFEIRRKSIGNGCRYRPFSGACRMVEPATADSANSRRRAP